MSQPVFQKKKRVKKKIGFNISFFFIFLSHSGEIGNKDLVVFENLTWCCKKQFFANDASWSAMIVSGDRYGYLFSN